MTLRQRIGTRSVAPSGGFPEPHSSLVIVWWLWLAAALMVLPLPVQWYAALLTRGLEAVSSSGIGGDGFAILGSTAVSLILGGPPFVIISLLYGFLFWRHRERGIPLTTRFWVPIYGAALLLVMLAVMVLAHSRAGGRESWTPPSTGLNIGSQGE
jgi:hypothetical protein